MFTLYSCFRRARQETKKQDIKKPTGLEGNHFQKKLIRDQDLGHKEELTDPGGKYHVCNSGIM